MIGTRYDGTMLLVFGNVDMGSITPQAYQEMVDRLERNKHREAPALQPQGDPVDDESKLHKDIMDWCDKQWPQWQYRHERMDKKTRAALGVEDFTIFAPGNRTIHIECKARDEKQKPKQLEWQAKLKRIDHTLYVVRSMEDFMLVIAEEFPPKSCDREAERKQ